MKYLLISFVLALFCLGCNQPFSPKGPFEQKLVVYSVLSTDRDVQFVRVYTNYDLPGFDPFQNTLDNSVTSAAVLVTGPEGTFSFRDTLLFGADTSRYGGPIHAYVAAPFRPKGGNSYTLAVTAGSLGSTTATVSLPWASQIYINNGSQMLDDPGYNPGTSVDLQVHDYYMGGKGYVYQMSMVYWVFIGSHWQEKRMDVPVSVEDSSFQTAKYPSFQPIVYPYSQYGSMVTIIPFSYSIDVYEATINRIANEEIHQNLIFSRVVFRFLHAEAAFYDYCSVVHRSQDPFTIRLDVPDYTNLNNGYGLFGACTIDSLVHYFPFTFRYNHNPS